MELLQLKYFCDAAKTENFSQTAAKFFVPPSNISQMIKRLEAELGVELFEHRGNKVVLAEAGKRFYTRAAVALSMLDDAKAEAASAEKVSGDIKIIILCNRRVVTEAIEKFKSDYPHINFTIRHEQGEESDCDILISDKCPAALAEHSLLLEEDMLLAVSREHPLAAEDVITPEALHKAHFVSMPRGRSLYTITTEICKSLGFLPNITIQTDDPYYIRKYVELGLGVAFFPECSWKGLFSENAVMKKVGNYTRKTYICLPKQKKMKSSVDVFLKYLSKSQNT